VLAALLMCGCVEPPPETTLHSPNRYPEANGSEPTAQEAQLHLLAGTADAAPSEPAPRPATNWQYD
jgi:hypothetical protein